MAQAPLREHYDSDEEYFRELDIYNTQVSSDLENVTAGMADAASVARDNQDRPVIGGIVQAYQERYLLTRYATSPDGTVGFTPDYTTISGLTVYQGLRESASSTESSNPIDYIWRELNISSGWTPSFRTVGGRQIDWMFGSSVPSGFTEDTSATIIDLDSLPGAVGADGNSVGTVVAFIRSSSDITSTTPAATTYNTATGAFNAPTGYSKSIPQIPNDVDIYATYATVFGSGTVSLAWGSPSLYGQAGADSTIPGPTGPRTAIRRVYLTAPQADAPDNPSATSINYTTGNIAGLTPTTWQDTPPISTITSTTLLYWSIDLQFVETVFEGTQTVTAIGTPSPSVNFGTDIQSDNFVTNSAGWQIQRDTGNAEFDNVLIRGDSVVEASTIGSNTLVTVGLSEFDQSVNGELVDSISPNAATVSSFEPNIFATGELVGGEADYSSDSGQFSLYLTLSDGTADSSTTISDYADSGIVLTFRYSFYDIDGDFISMQETEMTLPFSDISVLSTGIAATALTGNELPSFTAPQNAVHVEIRVGASADPGVNWGFIQFRRSLLWAMSGVVDRPTDSALFSGSSHENIYSMRSFGGRGVKFDPQLVFSGRSTNVFASSVLRDLESPGAFVQVEVQWDDSAQEDFYGGIFTIYSVGVTNLISETSGTNYAFTSGQAIYSQSGKYVGFLWIEYRRIGTITDSHFNTVNLDTTGGDSSISNAAITRIWKKME